MLTGRASEIGITNVKVVYCQNNPYKSAAVDTNIGSVNKSHMVTFPELEQVSTEYQIYWLRVRGQRGTDL